MIELRNLLQSSSYRAVADSSFFPKILEAMSTY